MAQTRDLSALVSSKAKKEKEASKPESQLASKPAGETKKKTFRLQKDMATRFAILAKQRDVTEQELLGEALELLFERYDNG